MNAYTQNRLQRERATIRDSLNPTSRSTTKDRSLRKRTSTLHTYFTHTQPINRSSPTSEKQPHLSSTSNLQHPHHDTYNRVQQQPQYHITCYPKTQSTHTLRNTSLYRHLRLRRGRERLRRFMNNFDFTLNQRSPRNTVRLIHTRSGTFSRTSRTYPNPDPPRYLLHNSMTLAAKAASIIYEIPVSLFFSTTGSGAYTFAQGNFPAFFHRKYVARENFKAIHGFLRSWSCSANHSARS